MKPLQQAVRWAAKHHRGQDRDGVAPLPYVAHPIDVMHRLRYVGNVYEEAALCAAALHDLVEECSVELDKIEDEFGADVRGLVEELTRSEPTPEQTEGLTDDEIANLRSEMLLQDIERMSPRAQAIKLADRASNLTAYRTSRPLEKLARYIRQSYLILEIIPRDVNPPLWDSVQDLLSRSPGPPA